MARVAELVHYPVKGCAGSPLQTGRLEPAGLVHDRSFMVVGADGGFRNQRRHPEMALIRPEVGGAGRWLTLHAPGMEPVTTEVDTTGPRRGVELFGVRYRGIDQGDAVAGWLSQVLGARCRLVRVPPEHDRVTDGRIPGTSGYADSCAVHLVSRSSLELLNRRIVARGGASVPMSRFRPNVVVDDWPDPHTEDRVRRIEIGDARLDYAKLTIRCAVTTVDQISGSKAGPEPLRTLAGYRRAAVGGVAFGIDLVVAEPGKLAVGDEVSAVSWAASELGPGAAKSRSPHRT